MYRLLINTHKNNAIALNTLLNSVPVTIPLLIVEGGHEHTQLTKDAYGRYTLAVNHNSIDFTGIIGVIQNIDLLSRAFDLPTAWFYIHDTCEIDNPIAFESIFQRINIENSFLCKSPSMNMGIYKHNHILKHIDAILAMKSSANPSIDEIQSLKRKCVLREDFLLKLMNTRNVLSKRMVCPGYFHYPSSRVDRIREYYATVGLFKYKANWHTKATYELQC